MGYKHSATRLVLFMDHPLGLVPFIHKVQELLCIVAPLWPAIVSLHAELQSDSDATGEAAAELASKFATILPSVTKLYVNAEVEDNLCKVFASTLINCYAPQLAHCECYIMLDSVDAQFSTDLKNVVVRLDDEAETSATSMHPESITHFYIAGSIQRTVDHLFSADTRDAIEFTNLEQLCILSPVDEDSDNKFSFEQLAFPKLSVLRTNPSNQAKHFLNSAQFPDHLDKLELLTLHIGTIALYNIKFGTKQREQLATFIDDEERVEFWSMANYLFGTFELCTYSVFTLGHLDDMPSIDNIAWDFLVKLEIIPTVESSLLLELIPRLRNTKEIVVHSLEFSMAGSWPQEKPSNGSLEILRLNYTVTDMSNLCVMALLVRLLPGLPSIEELFMPAVPPEFYSFVDEY
ncbi:hypothetical protein IWW43_003135, partial [Coemansia sp. RSA 1935]